MSPPTAMTKGRSSFRKAVVLPGHFIKTDTPDRHYTAVVQFKDYPHLDFSVPVLKDEKGLIPVPFPPSQYAFHSLAPHAL